MSLLNSRPDIEPFGPTFEPTPPPDERVPLVPSARVWYRPLRRRQYSGARRLPATVLRVGAVRTLLDVELGNGEHVRVAVSRSRIDPDETAGECRRDHDGTASACGT
jgi:hypothetical protein